MADKKKSSKKSPSKKKTVAKSCNKKCANIPVPPPVPPAPVNTMNVKDALKLIKDKVFSTFGLGPKDSL